MIKADATVRRETRYIAFFCAVLSGIMQIVFLIIRKWNYTVILGNILSFLIAVLNFYFMGISVQKALCMEASDARKTMKVSQSLRNVAIFTAVVLGVLVPYFNTVAVILPLFFPRVAVSFRPFFKEKEVMDR